MRIRLVFLVSHSLAVMSWAGAALATPNFPPAIHTFVGSAADPPCTICHNNPLGGLMTVTTTFGVYMRSQGLMLLDLGTLQTALMADQAAKHVSNSQGITDIDALRMGLDPNNPTATAMPGSGEPPPAYGCGAQIASRTGSIGAGPAILFALALPGLARRLRGRLKKQST